MVVLGQLLLFCITVYSWIIVINVLISWLIAFEVINVRNPQAQNLVALLEKATEPVYRPLRKYIPPIGGIDITPIVVLFGLQLIAKFVIIPLFMMSPVIVR